MFHLACISKLFHKCIILSDISVDKTFAGPVPYSILKTFCFKSYLMLNEFKMRLNVIIVFHFEQVPAK